MLWIMLLLTFINDPVTLTKENQTSGSGVLGFFDTPTTLTLKDVLSMMVITSDNTATNVAIDKIGLDAVNAEMGRLGLKNTWLYKKIGKPAGILTGNEDEIRRYISWGYTFVAVGSDIGLLGRGADMLAKKFKS